MAKFSTYAEVLTPEHVMWKSYIAGVTKNPPGVVLAEILKRTKGVYENRLELSKEFRERVRAVAALTGDQELMRIAGLTEVTISLEHLRHVDPQTRIVNGYQILYTQEESERLGLASKAAPSDPKNTIVVNLDPANPRRVAKG